MRSMNPGIAPGLPEDRRTGVLVPLGMNVAHAADAPAKGARHRKRDLARGRVEADHGRQRPLRGERRRTSATFPRAAPPALAQYPIASIVSCADSRVAPELAFDQAPGDLFVVRVWRATSSTPTCWHPSSTARSSWGRRSSVVLGHSNCGAIDAAIKVVQTKAVLPGHLPELIAGAQAGRHRRREDQDGQPARQRGRRERSAASGETQELAADHPERLRRQEDRHRRRRL